MEHHGTSQNIRVIMVIGVIRVIMVIIVIRVIRVTPTPANILCASLRHITMCI